MDSFELKRVASKVYAILTEIPACREDDRLLLYIIWSKESKAQTIDEFFVELIDGTLTHFESIRRMRQKIQEKHEELRGENYDGRQRMGKGFPSQMTFFDAWNSQK